MDLSLLDKASFQIIRKWNLDNLEYVLGTVSNQMIKQHPFWYYLVPYDGLLEVLASMVMEDDPIDVGLKLLALDTCEDPLRGYRLLIKEAREKQAQLGLENILVVQYTRWALAEQKLSQFPYTIKPTAVLKQEFYSDPMALKTIYGDSWKQYYRPKGRAV